MPPANHIVRHRQRVEEAGADRSDVEGDAVVDAEHGLHDRRGGREGLVGRGGGEHDQPDLAGLDAGRGQRLAGGLGGQGAGGLALAGDMAGADAGALGDPFVGRVDILPGRQFVVGDAARGAAPRRCRR